MERWLRVHLKNLADFERAGTSLECVSSYMCDDRVMGCGILASVPVAAPLTNDKTQVSRFSWAIAPGHLS